MQIFAKGRGEAKGAIVTKNSPLGPIMSFTILQLMEQGAVDRALSKFQASIKVLTHIDVQHCTSCKSQMQFLNTYLEPSIYFSGTRTGG